MPPAAATVEQANHRTAASPSRGSMMSAIPSSPASIDGSVPNGSLQQQQQQKLEQLRYAAWENDLTEIKDILQSLEDEGVHDHRQGAAFDYSPSSMMMMMDEPTSAANHHQNGFGPLHYAASMGNIEMLQSILAANVCDVDEVDKDGNTALMWAISHVSAGPASSGSSGGSHSPSSLDVDAGKRTELELIEALVDSGANPNKANYEGVTPLMAAVKLGCVEKVALLLENGADPNLKDIDGATCLHFAASLGLETITALLLRNGAFLNCRDEWDECALHWAVREGGESAARIVKLLAEHGAILDIGNDDGETPLDLAVETGDDRMVQTLLSLGAMGSGFDAMSIADDYCLSDRAGVEGRQEVFEPQQKASPVLLAWSAEANRVARACEQSLTHLAA